MFVDLQVNLDQTVKIHSQALLEIVVILDQMESQVRLSHSGLINFNRKIKLNG